MTLNFQRFAYAPAFINAVQVTADNMIEVAEWCNGTIVKTGKDDEPDYIKVQVKGVVTRRQTMAFENDWVFKAGPSFKVYTPRAFGKAFVPVNAVATESDPKAVELLEKIFSEPPMTAEQLVVAVNEGRMSVNDARRKAGIV